MRVLILLVPKNLVEVMTSSSVCTLVLTSGSCHSLWRQWGQRRLNRRMVFQVLWMKWGATSPIAWVVDKHKRGRWRRCVSARSSSHHSDLFSCDTARMSGKQINSHLSKKKRNAHMEVV
ncbi:hypothetical protein V8C35DRAFT_315796 [Trichoderma chlorosporum]